MSCAIALGNWDYLQFMPGAAGRGCYKSLVKNFERTHAQFKLCLIRLMLKPLAASIHVDRSRNIDPSHIASE